MNKDPLVYIDSQTIVHIKEKLPVKVLCNSRCCSAIDALYGAQIKERVPGRVRSARK